MVSTYTHPLARWGSIQLLFYSLKHLYILRPFDSGNGIKDVGWFSGLQLECVGPQPFAAFVFIRVPPSTLDEFT